jgi:1,4-dihydroxy-2-naphthoate octaprenyltransferase
VVLGKRATQGEFGALLGISYAVPALLIAAWIAGWSPAGGDAPLVPFVLLPLLTLPLASPLLRGVRTFREARELNLVLRGTARLSLVFSLLFALGLALAGASFRGSAG